ncbi:MAG: DUF4476 domain-containing protein [Marinilabiliaceae bacterium]|nr:DUF4476 domain-containing protein [Marinilabiliaceae bacterium]
MKKRTFLLIVCSFIALWAYAQNGIFTITSSNQNFWLFIDDVLQNEYSTNSIRIQGLEFKTYKVRVEMDNADYNCVGQTIQIYNQSNQNNYLVSHDRQNNYQFGKTNVQSNHALVQNLILPNYSYYSDYQQFLYPGFNQNANYGQNQNRGNSYRGYQNQGGRGYGNNQGYGGNQGYVVNPGNTKPIPCMQANDFNKALSVIKSDSFESSKLSTAKQISNSNYLCVSQIIQICKLFAYEQSKLEYAKYAYNSCVDKSNYFQINEVFSYTNSKDELRQFIERR